MADFKLSVEHELGICYAVLQSYDTTLNDLIEMISWFLQISLDCDDADTVGNFYDFEEVGAFLASVGYDGAREPNEVMSRTQVFEAISRERRYPLDKITRAQVALIFDEGRATYAAFEETRLKVSELVDAELDNDALLNPLDYQTVEAWREELAKG